MGNEFYLAFEPALIEGIQSVLNPALKTIIGIISEFGTEAVLVPLLCYLYLCYDKEYGKYIGTNMVVGLMCFSFIKNIACRKRPYMVHKEIKCLQPIEKNADIYDIKAQGYSFPSGHSTNTVAVYGSMAYGRKNVKFLTVLAIIMPILIAATRVALGVHYPTDVITGLVIGTIVLFVVSYLQNKVKRKWILHICLVAVFIPGVLFCATEDYFSGLGVMIGMFLAINFEEKFVNFENTKSIPRSIIRIIAAMVIYVIMDKLLEVVLPKPEDMVGFVCKALKNIFLMFLIMGLFPMVFKYFDRFGKKKEKIESTE